VAGKVTGTVNSAPGVNGILSTANNPVATVNGVTDTVTGVVSGLPSTVTGTVSGLTDQLTNTVNGLLSGTGASGSASVNAGGGLLGLNLGL
jgi:hypothetical protein